MFVKIINFFLILKYIGTNLKKIRLFGNKQIINYSIALSPT